MVAGSFCRKECQEVYPWCWSDDVNNGAQQEAVDLWLRKYERRGSSRASGQGKEHRKRKHCGDGDQVENPGNFAGESKWVGSLQSKLEPSDLMTQLPLPRGLLLTRTWRRMHDVGARLKVDEKNGNVWRLTALLCSSHL